MKKLILLSVIFILSVFTINAQEWKTNLEQAKEIAAKENKKIVMVFQGSDWCAPCMKLDKYVWSTEEFKKHAMENYVMVKVDFPRKRKNQADSKQQAYNGKLAKKYNSRGTFPMVVVMNKDGKILGKTGYKKKTAKEYIKLLSTIIDK